MAHSKHITQLPLAERPREKFIRKGTAALTDLELLSLVVGSGNATIDVTGIARRIQRLLRQYGASITLEDLTAVKGISTATAAKILASIELARRHLVRDVTPLNSMIEILGRLHDIRDRQQEYLICISLDGGLRPIAQRTISVGILDTVPIHPREVFSDAIADRAASILVAHNHPSGNARPSPQDVALTQQLASAGQLLGVELRDHIIVTRSDYFSYRQNHLL